MISLSSLRPEKSIRTIFTRCLSGWETLNCLQKHLNTVSTKRKLNSLVLLSIPMVLRWITDGLPPSKYRRSLSPSMISKYLLDSITFIDDLFISSPLLYYPLPHYWEGVRMERNLGISSSTNTNRSRSDSSKTPSRRRPSYDILILKSQFGLNLMYRTMVWPESCPNRIRKVYSTLLYSGRINS